jgi:diguanylate cyclase (GGDEF)-like protein
VLYVDLDRFKPINDTFGHVVGDHALVVCARRLERLAGPADTVGRLGGDEFALACAGIDPAGLEARAEQVVASLGQPFRIGAHLVEGGASVGVAHTDGGHAPDAVVAAADRALYVAKHEGRATWRAAPRIATGADPDPLLDPPLGSISEASRAEPR